jgi:hypothetical protein
MFLIKLSTITRHQGRINIRKIYLLIKEINITLVMRVYLSQLFKIIIEALFVYKFYFNHNIRCSNLLFKDILKVYIISVN